MKVLRLIKAFRLMEVPTLILLMILNFLMLKNMKVF